MKQIFRTQIFFLFSLFIEGLVFSQPALKIVQPYENANLMYVTQSFVFGSVSPATATLFINGTSVVPYTNGGFLTMIPFQEGRFKIEAVASDGVSISTVTRFVNVAEATRPFPQNSSEIQVISPPNRIVLRGEDILNVACKGAPQGTAFFKFKEKGGHYPMVEVSPGLYRGVYKIQPEDNFDYDDVIFFLRRADGRKISKRAKAEIVVQKRRTPRFVELSEDATLLTGPGSEYGYNLFLLKGVRLEVTGEYGDYVRVDLDSGNTGWLARSTLRELPPGTPPAKSVSRNIRIQTTEGSTVLELPLSYVHAHRVDEFVNPYRMELTLFGVVADTDRIHFIAKDSIIKEIYWKQFLPESFTLVIITDQSYPWGYEVRYEGTKLILELRHRPRWEHSKTAPLRGLKIAVDAGHSTGSYGTIGPLGNTEASVNLLVAKAVEERLKNLGASVVMTQDGTKDPFSLQSRIDLAWKEKANIFVSIHSDACAEGENPREVEGFSVHYYNVGGELLGEILRDDYGKKSGIRDQGLWRSNLAVCRATTMPSILFEQGFLILPEFEERFLKKDHQQMVAHVVGESIVEFMKRTQSK